MYTRISDRLCTSVMYCEYKWSILPILWTLLPSRRGIRALWPTNGNCRKDQLSNPNCPQVVNIELPPLPLTPPLSGGESWTQHLLHWVTELWEGLRGEPGLASSTLSHWAVERSVWRAGLGIFCAESLSCGEACGECQTQFFYTKSLVLYIVIRGRLSKSLLSLWRRLSCSYTESPLVVYIKEEESDSASLLSHLSSGLANPCWVCGRRLQ